MLKGGLTNVGGGGAELLVTMPGFLMGSQGCRHPVGAPSLHSKHGESIAGLQILEKSDKCTTQKAARRYPTAASKVLPGCSKAASGKPRGEKPRPGFGAG